MVSAPFLVSKSKRKKKKKKKRFPVLSYRLLFFFKVNSMIVTVLSLRRYPLKYSTLVTAGRAMLPAHSGLLNEPEENPENPCKNGTPRSSRGWPRLLSSPFFIWPDIFVAD